ncbi:helix-turn-helix transcriptional regulator [Limibacillus halophilus]|uniref:DNA-binding CsgD family transcriptional regulator n=1 Tax=Limibacillus halophilus TaxID=1579333 RepID=A0A839SZ55_9PROT|nr:LuxR family transcriptional regulator [Limibacillus halophilus]MBB3066203.1 DNA-binding CsgD family transcriptional regulator [Limibacillus halophilus]
MSGDRDWHQELAKAVRALRTPDFPQTLVAALGTLVSFDFSVMFAYRGDERPLDLFDNFGETRREIFVSIYQEGPYLLDPFFQASRDSCAPGLYRIRELAPDRFYQSEYFRSYYVRTGLSEEIGFFIALPEEVRAVISLMRAGKRQTFSEKEMARLRLVEPVVRAAAEYHWENLSARFSAERPDPEQEILERHIDATFRNFGRSLLSPREREVAGLILRGHSSDSISKILGIAAGTVKVHRKNTYSKLGIASQSELFSIFLGSLSQMRSTVVPPPRK